MKLETYIIIILYILHFIGPSGDPGYEGFIIGTKGESGDRGSILDINTFNAADAYTCQQSLFQRAGDTVTSNVYTL